MRVLFVCSRNRRRSPTAEVVFGDRPGWEVASAGLSPDAGERLSPEDIEWADVVFVMEAKQRVKLTRRFSSNINGKRVVCLNIPDNYEYMQPELIAILKEKVQRLFPDN